MTEQHKATPEQWVEIDLGKLNDGLAALRGLRARVEALEATQRPRVFTAEEVAPIMVPTVKDSLTAPASSLVERVGQVIADVVPGEDGFDREARAAIREVAAWLLDQHDSDQIVHTAWEAAKWLEQEATR